MLFDSLWNCRKSKVEGQRSTVNSQRSMVNSEKCISPRVVKDAMGDFYFQICELAENMLLIFSLSFLCFYLILYKFYSRL